MSFLLVVALGSLGMRTARVGGVATTTSRERRVRFEHRSQPAISVLGGELKSFARKTSAPSAPDLLGPEERAPSPDLPLRSLCWEDIAAGQAASIEFGWSRPRAPPALI